MGPVLCFARHNVPDAVSKSGLLTVASVTPPRLISVRMPPPDSCAHEHGFGDATVAVCRHNAVVQAANLTFVRHHTRDAVSSTSSFERDQGLVPSGTYHVVDFEQAKISERHDTSHGLGY